MRSQEQESLGDKWNYLEKFSRTKKGLISLVVIAYLTFGAGLAAEETYDNDKKNEAAFNVGMAITGVAATGTLLAANISSRVRRRP